MIRLVGVELTRLRKRRAVVVLLLLALMAPLIVAAGVAWETRPVSAEETARARELVQRELGVPGLRGGRGDLVVTVVVETPTRLDDRQRELLRELAGLRREESPTGDVRPEQKSVFSRFRDAFNQH